MVFESVVADLLNRFLGDYVENLNRSQLKIGIWGGDVVLENLVLKQNALDELDLPVQTVFGRLGKLVLKIPWKNLYGASVEASVERLFLLVEPNLQVKYNPEKEELLAQQSKQAELQRVEDAKKLEKTKLDEKVNDSFYEKLATQIVKNVQLKISEIHVRYEDKVTNPDQPFAFGITLHNLTVQTTDESWRATIVQEAVVKIFKVLTLEGLALYWNPKTPLFSTYSKEELLERFQNEIATKDTTPKSYDYILGPINASAKLKLNPKPEVDTPKFSIPKCIVSLDMEQLAIGLTKNQYRDVMMLADSMDMMTKGMPYRKYRPFLTCYRGHYKRWWHFAYTCILETIVKRRRREWNWEYISGFRSLCRQYAEAYETKLICVPKQPAKAVQELLEVCEKRLDVLNLVVIRQKVEMELERLGRAQEEAKKNRGWFGSWWGSGAAQAASTDSPDIITRFEKAMTPEEKEKMYRAIGYQENTAPPHLPPAFVSLVTEFRLRELLLCVRDAQQRLITSLRLSQAIVSMEQRPGANAMRVDICMQEMTVLGVEQKDLQPQIVSSQPNRPAAKLLNVTYETNPLDGSCDKRVIVSAQPLQFVYDAQTILDLVDVFTLQSESAALTQLQAAAGTRLSEFRQMPAIGLQYAVSKHDVLDVDINFCSSYLIVPFRGVYAGEGDERCCVVKFGEIGVKSAPRSESALNINAMHKQGFSEDEILQEALQHSYDKFNLEITDIQAIVARKGEKWLSVINSGEVTVMHLLQPTSLHIDIRKCLITDDPRLPKIKVLASLKELALTASEDRLATLLEVVTSIPLAEKSGSLTATKTDDFRGSTQSLAQTVAAGLAIPTRSSAASQNMIEEEYAQLTDLEAEFVVNELIVRVNRGGSDPTASTETLLTFSMYTMELKVTQKTYNLNVLIRLGGVALEHYHQPETFRLLDTPKTQDPIDSYLFYIQYTQVDKKSPDFHGRYGSVQQLVVFEFTTLQVLLHLESLQWILKFLADYQARMNLILMEGEKLAVSTPPPALAAIAEEDSEVPLTKAKASNSNEGRRKRVKRRESQTVQLKVRVAMKEVLVNLTTQKRPLASLALRGASAGLILRESYTQINMRLQQITVNDLNPRTIHKQILSIPGGDVLDTQIVIFNLEEFPDVSEVNVKMEVRVSCIRIVYLNWFIQSVLAFLNNFQQAEAAIAEASAAAADAARANVANAYQNQTKVLLRLRLQAPVIMAPESSFSESCALLDLGLITLTNNFTELTVPEHATQKVVIDELALALENLKASRVRLLGDGTVCDEHGVIEPISFILHTKRNISSSWYHNIPALEVSGRIKSIKASVSLKDYKMMMRILALNLSEGSDEAIAPVPPIATPDSGAQLTLPSDRKSRMSSRHDSQMKPVQVELTTGPIISMKFTFMMDNLSFDLMTISETDTEVGLARLGLVCLSVKGQMLSDGSLHTSVLLVDCILDDLRPRRESKISRYLERKTDTTQITEANSSAEKLKSMLDITYTQKLQDIFVDVRLYSFNLILAVDFLMKLSDFALQGLAAAAENDTEKPVAIKESSSVSVSKSNRLSNKESSTSTKSKRSTKETPPPSGLMTIKFKAEEPDIVLVESLEKKRCQAIVMKNELWVRMRSQDGQNVAEGGVSSLRLISCFWGPGGISGDLTTILKPCDVSLTASAPSQGGWHADIALSDISIHVSPKSINLVNRVLSTVMSSDENVGDEEEPFDTFSDVWDTKSFQENSVWFLKTELGQEAVEDGAVAVDVLNETPEPPRDEQCLIHCPSITIALDALMGDEELPVLSLEASFRAEVTNWSTRMNLESSWKMEMSYYNVSLALWEPLLEPIEVLKDNTYIHAPWEFKIQMLMNKSGIEEDVNVSSITSSGDEVPAQQPSSLMSLTSEYPLELSVTKTCLELLTQLSKSFAEAMETTTDTKESDSIDEGDGEADGARAPYWVQNETGFSVRLLLREEGGALAVGAAAGGAGVRDVLLEAGAGVALQLAGRAPPDLRLAVAAPGAGAPLSLPAVRADKRFFPLGAAAGPERERPAPNASAGRLAAAAASAASLPLSRSPAGAVTLAAPADARGILSEVAVVDHAVRITLRSIVQVTNNLLEPVEVFYMTASGNEVESLGYVESKCSMNLPLHAVYTPTGELFFSVKGYSVSVVPLVWRSLQREVRVTRMLQCDAKDHRHKDKFYMKGVGWMEQVYLKDTAKRTLSSACYNIELWPAVVLQNCLPVDVTISPQGMSEVKEHVMKAGETLHLPNVKPGTTKVVIMLASYLDKCWSTSGTLPVEGTEWTVWTLEAHDSTSLVCLDLGLHCGQQSGTQHFSLYCPFWMINKTGLMLSYRSNYEDSGNVLFHPASYEQPIMFSFRAKDFFGKKKAAIRVEFGEWSDKFSLDVAGSSGMINCHFDGVLYQVGVTNTLTYNSLTKLVTFTPYFLAVNKAPFDIEMQEADRSADPWVCVSGRSARAMWPRSENEDKFLRVRVADKPSQTSAPFIYTDQHTTLLRLDNQYGGVSVETQVSEGGVSVTFGNYRPGLAPVHLYNHSPHTITFWEKESINVKKLPPMSDVLFTWSNPAGPRILILEGHKKKEIENDLRMDGIGDFMISKEDRVYWVSFLDGRQRILLVTCDVLLAHLAHTAGESGAQFSETVVSLRSIGLSLVNNTKRQEILYVSMSSSGAIWEESKATGKRWRRVDPKETALLEAAWQERSQRLGTVEGDNFPSKIMLDGRTEVDFQNMELLRPKHRNLRRTLEPGAWLSMTTSAHTKRIHAKLHRLQIDQQLPNPTYPVTLAPVPPPKTIAASYDLVKPFAELSIVERIMEHTTIRQYKYWKLLVQEFHVKLDLGLVNALMEMFPQKEISEQEALLLLQQDISNALTPLSSASGREAIAEQKNFYDIIHLSPLKVHMSFSMGSASVGDAMPAVIGTLLQGIGVTLTEMNDVVFKLAFYERNYEFMSQKELISTVSSHYTGQAIKQLYVLVLGLDVIGNPYGLAIGIKKGVEDLFYEPFQGAIQGPSEFAEGLMLGVRSLVGHTLGGAAGAMSRITGAMGKGIATISGDDEFKRKRNEAMSKPPANLRQGLARSGKGLVMGVVDGVTGVFTKPISGAKEHGVEGFFKGLGKGAVGLVARPTAGVVDFASGSLDAVKRAAENSEEVARSRPPRWLMPDRQVRPYSHKQAEGYRMIREFDKGKYMATDTYEIHEWIIPNKEVLLLTDKRIIYLERNTVFGGWQLVWTFLWEELPEYPRAVDKGVFIPTNEAKKKVLGLFATQTAGKLVLMPEESRRSFLVTHCTRLMMDLR